MIHWCFPVVSQFEGAQVRWSTADKEAFAIMSGCRRGEWTLHERVTMFSNRRNLAYSFTPTVLVAELPKTATQRLLHWWTFWGSYETTSCTHRGRTNAGGICCHGEGKPARMPTVRFRGRWVAARSLFMRARMPTLPCRRRTPSRAVNCRRWRPTARWTRLPRRVERLGVTRRDCSGCQRALSKLCGFLPRTGFKKQGELTKLVNTRTGAWHVIPAAGTQHVHGVEDIVTGERK